MLTQHHFTNAAKIAARLERAGVGVLSCGCSGLPDKQQFVTLVVSSRNSEEEISGILNVLPTITTNPISYVRKAEWYCGNVIACRIE